ncbi:MAG: IMP dehydrogenase [bacterium]|nr:IMP dehydrogenase [bacterium]
MPEKEMDIENALTFDDILLKPAYSDILPREVDIRTQLTPKITLNIPLMSAAMDTVTESKMAIKMAKDGGIGIIHRGLTIRSQAEEVEKVKKYESGMVIRPKTISPLKRVKDARKIMNDQGISGLVVTDESDVVIGIVCNRDVRFVKDDNTRIQDVMTKHVITVREDTTPEDAKKLLDEKKIEKLPVVDESWRLRGLITAKDIEKTAQSPLASKDALGRLRCGAAVGVDKDRMKRIEELIGVGCDVIVIDTAHGDSLRVVNAVKEAKKNFPKIEIIAGNIATKEAAERLIGAGADGVKVGVGPGSICTTRVIAGVGVPQISAIREVASVARLHNIPVIADGGIKYSGDIAKALAMGASSVMIGNLFAGTDEAPGDTVLYQGRTYKVYRGMGSVGAMKKGARDRYAQDDMIDSKLVPEGVEGRVSYRGKLEDTVYQLLWGLRAGMGYTGKKTIPLLWTANLVRITSAGLRESHPHDVLMIEDPPNYQTR